MLVCFLDESNTPPKPTKRSPRPHFVIAGVFVPVAQWHSIADDLQKLKTRPEYRVRGEIKWRYFGPDNSDSANTVAHLTQEERYSFRKEFFSILTARKSVKIVAAVSNIEMAYRQNHINDEHDLYAYTYKPISERFQYHLQDLTRTTGQQHFGLIVSDHRGRKDDERLRREHQRLVHSTSAYVSSYANIIENLFLAPSHTSVGIQLADMAAGAISRQFNNNDSTWFDMITPAIRSKPDGDISGYGLVKVPGGW